MLRSLYFLSSIFYCLCKVCFVLIVVAFLFGCNKKQKARLAEMREENSDTFQPRKCIGYYTSELLAIDGVLKEASWALVDPVSSFVSLNSDDSEQRNALVKVRVLWDSTSLYFGVVVFEKHIFSPQSAKCDIAEGGNAFEIYLDPDGDTHHYLKVTINPEGKLCTANYSRPFRDGGVETEMTIADSWSFSVGVSGTLNLPDDEDEKWSVELALPLVELAQLGMSDSADFRINFCSVHWTMVAVDGFYKKEIDPEQGEVYPAQKWVWAPTGRHGIHAPEFWGFLKRSSKPVGTGVDGFVLGGDVQLKHELRQVYYAQKEYFKRKKRYANSLSSLKKFGLIKRELQFSPKLRSSKSKYDVSAQRQGSDKVWFVNEQGRVWFQQGSRFQ